MNHELKKLLLRQREEDTFHTSLENEFQFYRSIQQGDLTVLEGDMKIEPLEGMGTLSSDSLRNIKYHLIILIAMITRFCVEGGLDSETAYTMSDMYIRQVDQTLSQDKLSHIKKEVITQYTRTMHNLKKQKPASLPVIHAIEYIENHLTSPLTNTEIGKAISCNPDYLSRLFKKETGLTLNHYILEQKCHTACYMLENSSASCTSISAFLGFSSCSHFIIRFKRIKGMTPEEYRRSKIRNTLSSFALPPETLKEPI